MARKYRPRAEIEARAKRHRALAQVEEFTQNPASSFGPFSLGERVRLVKAVKSHDKGSEGHVVIEQTAKSDFDLRFLPDGATAAISVTLDDLDVIEAPDEGPPLHEPEKP